MRDPRSASVTAAPGEGFSAGEGATLVESFRAALEGIRRAPERDRPTLAFALGNEFGRAAAAPLFFIRATLSEAVPSALREILLEGFFRGALDAGHARELEQWGYPACAVPVDATCVAIAANPPTDDSSEIRQWADSVAVKVAKAGYRFAVVEGHAARDLAEALALIGVHREADLGLLSHLRRRFRRT